jgi:ketosteroid isomerase-like protein
MSHYRLSLFLVLSILSIPRAGFAAATPAIKSYVGTDQDRVALQKTGEAIRAAFARGDIETIMAYHHPDVIKLGTLQAFNLEFEQFRDENIFFQGDTAVEQSVFTIKGTPKGGGPPFLFKGRSLVVYVRYKKSPTGWASIRELIQPAP